MKSPLVTLLTVTLNLLATEVNFSIVAEGNDAPMLCVPEVHSHFNYDPKSQEGPYDWAHVSGCCEGHRQSPRNLISHSPPSDCDVALPQFTYQDEEDLDGELYDSGHAPTVAFNGPIKAILTGAPYSEDSYVLANIHMHFNNLNGHGSEHAIDGHFYEGELHMVHFNSKYGDVVSAMTQEDGLLVIGIMLEIVEEQQVNEITNLIGEMVNIKGVGKENSVPVKVNPTLLLPATKNFFTYAGSLTTPPCSESVRWVVMQEPRKINNEQMKILMTLKSDDGSLISAYSNDRPLQESNTVVQTNFAC